MFLFQPARLSHYGGGKSSLTEVETLLVFPPPPVFGFRAWYESSTSIPDHHFVLFFSRHRLVSSVCNTSSVRCLLWFFIFLAWVTCMDGCPLCSLLKNVLCMVENGQHGSECSPLFFCLNVHLWCLCNILCVMWPTFHSGICGPYGSLCFPCRDTGEVFETETAACFSISYADWGRVQIHFA